MRIICDHCDRPISGTVKRFPGNFNLHPDCLAQFDKAPKHGSNAAAWASQKYSIGTLVEWKESVLVVQERLGKRRS